MNDLPPWHYLPLGQMAHSAASDSDVLELHVPGRHGNWLAFPVPFGQKKPAPQSNIICVSPPVP
jgi:hypothetical protein